MKNNRILVALLMSLVSVNGYATPLSDTLIKRYESISGQEANAQSGETFWNHDNNGRSCNSCHGSDVTQTGKHVKTKRVIKPLSPSVNAERLTDEHEIEKWFKRNCKWTVKRECTPSEKADVLKWLSSQ